jgi:hypothetical protein
MVYDALGAHSRGDLGIFATLTTRPIRAALVSAASFAIKASMPLLVNAIAPEASLMPLLFGTHWYFLGSCVDWLCVGGAPITAGVMRACCCRQLLRFFAWWCRLPVELCL